MSIQSIRLDQITTDAGTQVRAKINLALVTEYAQVMTEGVETFPPVVLFNDDSKLYSVYFLADGFHRVRAAEKAGLEEIRAEVFAGGLKEAQEYAATANRTHGLNRTNEDKRRAVLLLMQLRPNAANRDIARDVGVSHTYVNTLREGAAGGNVSTSEPAGEPVPMPVAAGPDRASESMASGTEATVMVGNSCLGIVGPMPMAFEPLESIDPGDIGKPRSLAELAESQRQWLGLDSGELVAVPRAEWEAWKALRDGPTCQLCAGAGHMSEPGTARWNEFRAWEDSGAPKSKPPKPVGPLPGALDLSRDVVKPMFKTSDRKKLEKGDEYERSEDSRASRFEDAPTRRPLVQHANGGAR